MDVALCTDDGHVYTAIQFAAIPPLDLALKRRLLQCTHCFGPAFFRKASTSGQAACFGARPHAENCPLRAVDNDPVGGVLGADDEIFNPGDRIVVDLNFGAAEQQHHVDAAQVPIRNVRGRQYVGNGGRPDAIMHRRLSSLLRTLVAAPNFRYSDQIISIDGQHELPVRDFFVQFGDVTPQYSGQFRGYWGMLSDAAFSNGALWLNSGGRGDISFCIQEEHVTAIMERYRFEDEESFAGAYVLALGTVRVSQYNKVYCVIEHPSLIAIRA